MVGSRQAHPGRAAVLAATLLALGGPLPAPTAAAELNATFVLPGGTHAAVTADLDGDGSAEVVRMVGGGAGGRFGVEAWRFGDDGWVSAGWTELPVSSTIAALLPWSNDGRDEVLALTVSGESANRPGVPCCLDVQRLWMTGGDPRLEPMPSPPVAADHVATADLDADGTDELVLSHSEFDLDTGIDLTRVTVLRREAGRWRSSVTTDHPGPGFGLVIGDVDGRSGDEVVIGPSEFGDLVRLAWDGSGVTADEGHLDLGERSGGWLVGIAGGSIVVTGPGGTRVVEWPRAQRPTTVARTGRQVFPSVWVVGDGPEALIVLLEGFPFRPNAEPAVTVYDLGLTELGTVPLQGTTAAVWELMTTASTEFGPASSPFFPYVGPFPGGPSGEPSGYATGGVLVEPAEGGFEVGPIGSLIGQQPMGRAGPDGSWVMLGTDVPGLQGGAYLFDRVDLDGSIGSGVLSLTPIDDLLRPDAEAWSGSLELHDAVDVVRDGARATLLAAADGFTAVVTAPPGSTVVVFDGRRADHHEIGDEPLELRVEPRARDADDENEPFERWVLAIGPGGHGSLVHWEGTFVRESPELSAGSETPLFALRSTISGRASGGATVTVDGRPVDVGADGSFRADVDAPIWPREVVVAARDPLGNEAHHRLDVIGFVDYRGLPWTPIVAAVTLVAGIGMFLRTPKRRSLELDSDLDGRLEEIDDRD